MIYQSIINKADSCHQELSQYPFSERLWKQIFFLTVKLCACSRKQAILKVPVSSHIQHRALVCFGLEVPSLHKKLTTN